MEDDDSIEDPEDSEEDILDYQNQDYQGIVGFNLDTQSQMPFRKSEQFLKIPRVQSLGGQSSKVQQELMSNLETI